MYGSDNTLFQVITGLNDRSIVVYFSETGQNSATLTVHEPVHFNVGLNPVVTNKLSVQEQKNVFIDSYLYFYKSYKKNYAISWPSTRLKVDIFTIG